MLGNQSTPSRPKPCWKCLQMASASGRAMSEYSILSRCQRFDFKRIPVQKVVARLRHIACQENITISDEALTVVARKGDGSMRDSLSTLDQVLAFCGNTVGDEEVTSLLGVVDRRLLLETSHAVFSKDCRTALEIVKKIDEFGYNMRHFCQELINHFRNLTIIQLVEDPSELLDLAEGELTDIKSQASRTKQEDLQRHLTLLLKAETEMALSGFPRLILELVLVKMCSLTPVVPARDILDRLRVLEETGKLGPCDTKSLPDAKPHSSRTTPVSTERKNIPDPDPVPAAGHQAAREPGAKADWPGFVAFAMGKKISLGSLLEHGHPLQISPSLIKIGFPAGSFGLTALKDPDSMSALKELIRQYFHEQPTVELVALAGSGQDVPPSELEKKNIQASERLSRIDQDGRNHPMVAAAVEIFGGEIGEIREIEKNTKEKQ